MLKKVLGYLLVLSFCVVGGCIIHQLKRDYRRHREGVSSYKPLPLDQVTEKKKFVVVIPSFCNEKYVERNLRSVFEQDYDNYRVIYIDDCSTDGTSKLAQEMIVQFGMEDRVTFIQNRENRGRTANDYYAIHSCENDEIIVSLDGDDWFAHTGVLSELNRYYNDENVWVTYGQMVTYPQYKRWNAKEPLFNRLKTGKARAHWHCFRYYEWIFAQPRTFYAGLFKRLKVKDLFYEGDFTKVVGDVAMMYPLLEMAKGHAVFIPNVAYVYNKETPLSDGTLRKKTQDEMYKVFFAKKPYPPLLEDPRKSIVRGEEESTAVVVFSQGNPLGLYDLLNSLEKKVSKVGKILVLYANLDESCKERYLLVQDMYPDISYVEVSEKENIKKVLCEFLRQSPSEYILLTKDTLSIKNEIHLHKAIDLLEKTGANGFYFSVGREERSIPIADGGFVWSFGKGYNVEMTLYPKNEVLRMVTALSTRSIDGFIREWESYFDRQGMGVCWNEATVR